LADPFLAVDSDNVSVVVEYDMDVGTLHSVTGYARSEVRDLDDCAGTPMLRGCVRGVRPLEYDQWS
jgi:hypothetical protein